MKDTNLYFILLLAAIIIFACIGNRYNKKTLEGFEQGQNVQNKFDQGCINACEKGMKFWDPNVAALAVIQKGLKNLGITRKAYEAKKYFTHGTSHYLGLDVHDVGLYSALKPGQVITVEPGIYIPEGSPCDKKWWNIGVRIEDDVLITEGAPEVLSACVPKTIAAIEALMKQQSAFKQLQK